MKRGMRSGVGAVLIVLAALRAATAETGEKASIGSSGQAVFAGLAQAPEASLFAGSATTSIPFDVPPGRKNMTPKLALSYNSGGGPSPYGLGWDLPLGKIQRCGKQGVLQCGGPYWNDFVVSMPGISAECRLEGNVCVPKVAESWIRIEYQSADNTWVVWDKSGMQYKFGSTVSARTGTNETLTSLYQGNANGTCDYTYSWALSRIEDATGNYLEIDYTREAQVVYPELIKYGGNTQAALAHMFEVDLQWEAYAVEDRVTSGAAGFASTLQNRLRNVVVKHGTEQVRRYELYYGRTNPQGASRLLSAVTLYGKDDTALKRFDSLPASTVFIPQRNLTSNGRFGFRSAESTTQPATIPPGRRTLTTYHHESHTTIPLSKWTSRDLIDINADGFPDLVDVPDGVPYWNVYLGGRAGLATDPVRWAGGFPLELSGYTRDLTTTSLVTIDVTGDGIPDLMGWPNYFYNHTDHLPPPGTRFWQNPTFTAWWVVRRGAIGDPRCGAGVYGCFVDEDLDADPLTDNWWALPLGSEVQGNYDGQGRIRLSVKGANGSVEDYFDLIDMNADGRPDIVQALYGFVAEWRIFFNTGHGFSEIGEPFHAQLAVIRSTSADGTLTIGMYDVNADGLIDQVGLNNGTLASYLNHGRGTTVVASTVLRQHEACPVNPQGIRSTVSSSDSSVVSDFFDINGDGYPDRVVACPTGGRWAVQLGRGNTLEDYVWLWEAGTSRIRRVEEDRDVDVNGPYAGILVAQETMSDTLDWDGDAMVDLVDFEDGTIGRNLGGAWLAFEEPNPDGCKPGLLRRVENGVGGATFIDYRPSTDRDHTHPATGLPSLPFVVWTVSRIESDDGLCVSESNCPFESNPVATNFVYDSGLYDPIAREFRGFGTVQQEDNVGTIKATWFHQDAARRGKIMSTEVVGPEGLERIDYSLWECERAGVPDETCDVNGGSETLDLRLRRETYYKHNWSTGGSMAFQAHDACGNVTLTAKAAEGTSLLTTTATFKCSEGIPATGPYILDRPTHVVTKQDGRTKPLEENWFTYSASGNVLDSYTWLDNVEVPGVPAGTVSCPTPPQVAGLGCLVTSMAYDTVGNPTSVVDANGNSTTTEYDTETRIYPHKTISSANDLTEAIGTRFDPACGKKLWETVVFHGALDPVGQPRSEIQYDTFCRVAATALPGDSLSSSPQSIVRYFLGGHNMPTTVATWSKVPNQTLGSSNLSNISLGERIVGYVGTATLTDGLGRKLQTHRDAVVDGEDRTVISGSSVYNATGNLATEYLPFAAVQAVGSYLVPPNGIGSRTYLYDALRRLRRVLNPDGTTKEQVDQDQWVVSTDECYSGAPGYAECTGAKVFEIRDGIGRTMQRVSYEKVNGTDVFKSRTGFAYDGLNRLIETKQGMTASSWQTSGPDTRVKTTYDSLGRRIKVEDPDSGTWLYGYDPVGNLVHQDDPKANQHIQFCYDSMNRMVTKLYFASSDAYCPTACNPTPNCVSPAASKIDYQYSFNPGTQFGRLVTVSSPDADTTYEYDVRGHTVKLGQTLRAPGNNNASAETIYNYNSANQLTSVHYPDSEIVAQAYDRVGQLKGVGSAYLTNAKYDAFGRATYLRYGNSVEEQRGFYAADHNHRLASIATKKGSVTYQELNYSEYWANGLLRTLSETVPAGVSASIDSSATYSYDGVGRLKVMVGANQNGIYAYDALGNMTAKDNLNLGYSSTRPHTLATINGSNVDLGHDSNGCRSKRPAVGGESTQTYECTLDDRVRRMTTAADTVDFLYDHSGQRIAKVVNPQSAQPRVTWYFAGGLAENENGWLTKYYYAGSTLVASWRTWAPQLAGLPPDPAVQLAADMGSQPTLVVLIRPGLHLPLAFGASTMAALLLLAPWKRKAVIGVHVRQGHVIGIVVVFTLTAVPMPWVVKPAWATGTGPTPTRTTSPTPIPTAPGGGSTFGFRYYHSDHLGSVQAITDVNGNVVRYIRYKPYGEVRGIYNASGTVISEELGADAYEKGFTGYANEPLTGLQYAGARVYDPILGQFLTHDPAREFANPYSYTDGDPINLSDPSGACVFFCLDAILIGALIGATIGFAASALQAASQGASLGQSLKAGAIGGAIGAASGAFGAAVLQPALGATVGALAAGAAPGTVQQIVNATMLTSGMFMAGHSAGQGDYTGLIGLGLTIGVGLAWSSLTAGQESNGQVVGNDGPAGVQYADARDGEVLNDASGPDIGPRQPIHGDNLEGLSPEFRDRVKGVLTDLEDAGWNPRVASGLRTQAEQNRLVQGGFSRDPNSLHLSGNAADVIDKNVGYINQRNHAFWMNLRDSATSRGLVSGSYWRNPWDPSHIQMGQCVPSLGVCR